MLAVAETPRVSVVMPVHNAMPYLDIAVESILGQTFQNFEFVILDDASTDGSTQRLREWAAREPRIRLIEVKRNLGPALSSQRVAEAARAPIVARMDADDISRPWRLAEQLEVLDKFPTVGVVGGLYDIIDAAGGKIRGPEAWRLVNSAVPPFGNGPMMYRREVPREAPAGSPVTKFARRDLYGDALNEAVFMRPGQYLTRTLVWFDNRVVDGLVNGLAALFGGLSGRLRRVQTGFVRSYALSMVFGAAFVVVALLAVRLS